jgi:chemotaxis family two-component system response regulator Rcp1
MGSGTDTGLGWAGGAQRPGAGRLPCETEEDMKTGTGTRPIEILLVEDDPGDVRLTLEVFKDAKVLNHVSVAADGVEAMAFLRKQGVHVQAPLPDLILLDLNLPRKDGRAVLAEIKSDPELKRVPVVVLTTSQDERDVLHAYNQYANCYITKPVDLKQFLSVVEGIDNFWLSIVKLPPKDVDTRNGM